LLLNSYEVTDITVYWDVMPGHGNNSLLDFTLKHL